MDINFELYKVFYMVAKAGSFTAAAKELFISQSAVSQSIKSLENNIGSKLFIRGSKNVVLTSVGEMLYSHVEQAYNLIKSAESKVNELKSLSLGEIRLGVSDTILRCLLLPTLQRFISDYPKIKIRITNRTTPGIIDSIKSGTVDLGIITLPVNDENLDVIEFREVEDIFVASSRFGYLKGKKTTPDELAALPLLLLRKESSTRRNLDLYFENKGIKIAPEIELESIELLLELSIIGLGVAHVLKESAAPLLAGGELFKLDLLDPAPARVLGIAKLRNVPFSPAAEVFVSRLKELKTV
jgi:DNA-binding transcriptional LysR family regulator